MSIGSSGRIVVEIEPDLKKLLHATLRLEGRNLKEWFLENVEQLLDQHYQQEKLQLEQEMPYREQQK